MTRRGSRGSAGPLGAPPQGGGQRPASASTTLTPNEQATGCLAGCASPRKAVPLAHASSALTTGRGKGAPPSAPLEWVLKPQPDRKTRLLRKMVLTNFVGKENDNNCNKSQWKLVSPVSLARDLSHPKSGSTRPPRPPCPGAPEPS